MGSDRARASYDETRQYRTVVMQQGRVTLEADWNESQVIATEEERKEALDFVGPAGTPDDGYRVIETGVVPAQPFDFMVDSGTMYVGGMRVFAPTVIHYTNQMEWFDHSTDPDWVDPANLNPTREEVFLLLREQEVSAVEDEALREVALGGPDTAQRTRLIQHIVRIPTQAFHCDDARPSLEQHFAPQGLTPHYDTMRLLSGSTLFVSFPPAPAPPDPCEPAATGGYLGADNQLIRVQISGSDGKGNYKFLWGYDDASFLYRVDVLDSTHVKLQSTPVDQFHRPDKVVEILRSAVPFDKTNFIASPAGIVATLTTPYKADTRIVTLPAPLPAEYVNSVNPIFLRVWEEEQPVQPAVAVPLGNSGLLVTLLAGGNVFHVGDFWLIAVRPSTPQKVYPERLLLNPQPPDGPRLWFCPLAVIGWSQGIMSVLEDCRNPFDDLVELTKRKGGGCCTVVVRPEDLKNGVTLQSILNKFVKREKIVVCLMPGHYPLDEPLRLGPEHSNLTLEACHDGAVLEARQGKEQNFLDGLVVLTRANNVTLRGLRFHLPQVQFVESGGKLASLDNASAKKLLLVLDELFVSIGVRPVHCAVLTIENCLFRFSLTERKPVFGVGIFAASECWGHRISRCRFVREEGFLRSDQPVRTLIGYLLMPTISLKQVKGRTARGEIVARTILQDARFEENYFAGLSAAATVSAQIGVIVVERNTIRECHSGFSFGTMSSLAFSTRLDDLQVNKKLLAAALAFRVSFSSAMQDPLIVFAATIARSYPLPREWEDAAQSDEKAAAPALTVKAIKERVQEMATTVLEAFRSADEGAAADTKETKLNVTDDLIDPAQRDFIELHVKLAEVELRQPAPQIPISMTLTVTANEIDTRVGGVGSSRCFWVADDDHVTESGMTVTGNIMHANSSAEPVLSVIAVERCAVAGNVVVNDNREAASIAIFPGKTGTVAVTGNVFTGTRIYPLRTGFTPPLNDWDTFNSVLG